MTKTDEEILEDQVFRGAKGTSRSSFGYWGGEEVLGYGFGFGNFLSYCSP
jgi:hypothetical protein